MRIVLEHNIKETSRKSVSNDIENARHMPNSKINMMQDKKVNTS